MWPLWVRHLTFPRKIIPANVHSDLFTLANLYEHGIIVQEDSIIISAEIQNVINNKELRDSLYPESYTCEGVVVILERMEIKWALWYFINLYPNDKEMVMKAIAKYNLLFEMDHALLGTFNTYAMVDPDI